MTRTIRKTVGVAVVAVSLAIPFAAQAQGAGAYPAHRQGPGRGPCNGRGAHIFDPQAVTTVEGDIVNVQAGQGRRGQGVFLTLAVGSEDVQVIVGPSFYLDQQSVKLAAGEKVEVKGSRTRWGGQAVLVAQEIRKGNEVLPLRDGDGVPLWAPGRR
jgi:hypothetical protein